MAISYYDEALYNKIQSWIKDPDMRILKTDETLESFRIRADKGEDKPLKLPFIDINRDKSFEVLRLGRTPLSCSGRVVASGDKVLIPLNAIPVSLSYQIDIYTRNYKEGDVYLRELLFNLINHPRLTVEIPYNKIKFLHNAYVRVLADVEDNSDIPERLFKSQFTRWTIQLTIDDAYLFGAPTVEIPQIESIGFGAALPEQLAEQSVDGLDIELVIDNTTD